MAKRIRTTVTVREDDPVLRCRTGKKKQQSSAVALVVIVLVILFFNDEPEQPFTLPVILPLLKFASESAASAREDSIRENCGPDRIVRGSANTRRYEDDTSRVRLPRSAVHLFRHQVT